MPHSVLKDASLLPADLRNDTSIYRLRSESLFNDYYIASSPGTRRLMASPEVIGFDSYLCMVPSTLAALDHLIDIGLDGEVSILTILRGGLNYPLEECCHRKGITVRNMDFISCERIIENGVITCLDIRYEKLHIEKDCTLMIGDIIASGDTLRLSLEQVVDRFRRRGGSIRRIIFFTIGGTKAIGLMEELTEKIRAIWPQFEGFNIPYIDFYWRDGIISPDFRYHVLRDDDALFEKCIIYDGGARRYEIADHYHEVMEYWRDLASAAGRTEYNDFLEEKIGHKLDIGFEDWLTLNAYRDLDEEEMTSLYIMERDFLRKKRTIREICERRLREFRRELGRYAE